MYHNLMIIVYIIFKYERHSYSSLHRMSLNGRLPQNDIHLQNYQQNESQIVMLILRRTALFSVSINLNVWIIPHLFFMCEFLNHSSDSEIK